MATTDPVAVHRANRDPTYPASPPRVRELPAGAARETVSRGYFWHVPPNLFASVMGTGIVAAMAHRFASWSPGFTYFGTAVWVLAAGWLSVLVVGLTGNWLCYRKQAVAVLRNPALLPFYGTVPMALLTVGAGALLFGPVFFGGGAVLLSGALWVAGTVLGIATAIAVPVRAVLSAHQPSDYALPSWMLPVVPPMVSATTGAALLDHMPTAALRTALQVSCYSLFGLALVVALLTLTMVYGRLVCDGAVAPAIAPTVWIPLGVIGQSIAAVNFLGMHNDSTLDDGLVLLSELKTIGILFGFAMAGFAVFWVMFALALTAHGLRGGMTFSLSWWSIVFPIGATALGLSALAEATGSSVLQIGSFAMYLALVAIWGVVAVGSVLRGHLAWWR